MRTALHAPGPLHYGRLRSPCRADRFEYSARCFLRWSASREWTDATILPAFFPMHRSQAWRGRVGDRPKAYPDRATAPPEACRREDRWRRSERRFLKTFHFCHAFARRMPVTLGCALCRFIVAQTYQPRDAEWHGVCEKLGLTQPGSFHVLELRRKTILLVGMRGIDQHHARNLVADIGWRTVACCIRPSNGQRQCRAAQFPRRAAMRAIPSPSPCWCEVVDSSRCSRLRRDRRSRHARIARSWAALCARK